MMTIYPRKSMAGYITAYTLAEVNLFCWDDYRVGWKEANGMSESRVYKDGREITRES